MWFFFRVLYTLLAEIVAAEKQKKREVANFIFLKSGT